MKSVWLLMSLGAALLACGCQNEAGNVSADVSSQPATAPTAATATPPTDQIVAIDDQNFSLAREGGMRRTGTDTNFTLHLPTDLLFDFDNASLRPEAEPMLREVLTELEGENVFALQVFGHTDAKGEEPYNMRLSLARAKAVCDYLKRAGKQYTLCLGRGEQEPVAANANSDGSDNVIGRQLNRRVDIKVAIRPDVKAMMDKARNQ